MMKMTKKPITTPALERFGERNFRIGAEGQALLFPVNRYFIRHDLNPVRVTKRYKPPESASL
jgi:hypothetical protein